MSKQQKQNFLQGALILSAAVAITKIIGAMFKIPLGNLIGTESYSMFTSAYNVYSTLLVISTAGLPVAVSKMVSEAEARGRFAEGRRIFRIAFATFCIIGAFGTAVMMLGARQIAELMNNPDAYLAIMAIAPAILFVCVLSSYRGYFQGRGNMYPTAISQVFEAAGKLVIGFGLAYWLFTTTGNLIYAAAGAIGGVTCGTVLGAIYISLYGRKDKPMKEDILPPRKTGTILSELLKIAIPITISSSVLSLTNLIDSSQVMGLLQDAVGMDYLEVKNITGAYAYSQTLFNLPAAFILTLSVSVIPAIAAAMAKGDKKSAGETITTSLKVTSLLSLPAAAGLMALSEPIMRLLYPGEILAVTYSAPLLFTLGYAVPFVCFVSLTNAILQSLGRVYTPIFTMIAGGTVKVLLNNFLLRNPDINIFGAPVGTVACYSLITVLNLGVIFVAAKPPKLLTSFIKPLFSAAAMGFAVYFAYGSISQIMGNSIGTIIAVAAGVVLYVVLVVLLKALSYNDVLLLPKGKSIANFLKISKK